MEEPENVEYEVELRDYLRVIWEKKWIILTTFLIAVGAALLFSFRMPSRYQTDALYMVKEAPKIEGVQLKIPSPQETIQILRSNQLLKETTKKLKLTAIERFKGAGLQKIVTQLGEDLRTEQPEGTNLVRLKLTGAYSPSLIEQILDQHLLVLKSDLHTRVEEDVKGEISRINATQTALKSQLDELIKEREKIESGEDNLKLMAGEQEATLKGIILREKFINLNSRVSSLQKRLDNLALTKVAVSKLFGQSWSPLDILSRPYAPEVPTGPKWKLNLAIAGVLGLIGGLMLAFFVHYLQAETTQENTEKS